MNCNPLRFYLPVILVILSLGFGCNDRNAKIINEPQISPQLTSSQGIEATKERYRKLFQEAIAAGYDIMTVSVTPDGGEVIEYNKFEDAIEWDGHTKIGVSGFYRFKSIDDAISAYANRPAMLDLFRKIKNAGGNLKKSNATPQLAAGDWYASVDLFRPQGIGSLWCEYVTHSPGPITGTVNHVRSFVTDPFIENDTWGYEFQNPSQQLNLYQYSNFNDWCPVEVGAAAAVYLGTTCKAIDSGQLDCGN